MNLKKIFLAITFLAVSIGIFRTNPPIIKAMTIEELLAEINRIQAQIVQLQKQLAELQGKPAAWCHNFNTNLRFGDSGLEVEALQTALEKEGFNVSGDTKGNFGENTASAVVSFQEKYKSEILGPWRLEHGTGCVGQTTRAKLNKLYGCGQVVTPATSWQRTYGGSDSDEGYSVIQTNDGGYIITGLTDSYDGDSRLGLIPDEGDVYLIKTDANGNLIWQKNYGGPEWSPGLDEGWSIAQTNDGGYIIAGLTESYGTIGDVYLIKTDVNGNLLWQKNYGGPKWDIGYSLALTSDGGYIIAGKTESYGAGGSDVYLIKTDVNGNLLWQKNYGGPRRDEGRSVAQINDGGYIIVGDTESRLNYFDVYLIKTDANGNMVWQKTYGRSSYDIGWSIAQTSDGGYIIAGDTIDGAYLIKTDVNGNLLWQKSYGGPESDFARSVLETKDGGYIIIGSTSSYSAIGDLDVYLIKTDSKGNMVWQKTYDDGSGSEDGGWSIAKTNDGGYIITGIYGTVITGIYGTGIYSTGEDVWLIKIAGE